MLFKKRPTKASPYTFLFIIYLVELDEEMSRPYASEITADNKVALELSIEPYTTWKTVARKVRRLDS